MIPDDHSHLQKLFPGNGGDAIYAPRRSGNFAIPKWWVTWPIMLAEFSCDAEQLFKNRQPAGRQAAYRCVGENADGIQPGVRGPAGPSVRPRKGHKLRQATLATTNPVFF